MTQKNFKESITCPCCEAEVICPFCKSKNIKKIVYGFVGVTDKDDFNKKHKFGGGIIKQDSPKFHCEACGKSFGKALGSSPWKEIDIKKVADEIKALDDEKKELEMKVDILRETEKKMKNIIIKNNKKSDK